MRIKLLAILSLLLSYMPYTLTENFDDLEKKLATLEKIERGITGITGALLILKGYADLNDTIHRNNNANSLRKAFWITMATGEMTLGLLFVISSIMGDNSDKPGDGAWNLFYIFSRL